jgi:endonuclease/exonuclease/phosphatase family metal-dependent hydrolase
MTHDRLSCRGVFILPLAAAALSLTATACSSGGQRPAAHPGPGRVGPQRVTVDGRLSDWPDGVAVLADPNYLYFKLGLETEASLMNSADTLTLLLDADGKNSTGARLTDPPAVSSMGVDVEIQFSPAGEQGGVAAFVHDSSGRRTAVTNDQIGLVVSPTHASQWFEVRISRHPDGLPALADTLAGSTSGKAMFTLAEGGRIVGWSDPEVFLRPAAAKTAQAADVSIPPKAPGSIRVVSWSVLKATPMTNPGPFARVLTALAPDIILVQQWDNADAATLQAWCTALLTGEGEWHARSATALGVGIISRYPVEALGPDSITISGADQPTPVRWVAGLVRTPVGDAAVASVHLACCGSMGSPEDVHRLAEARAVNDAMRRALGGMGPGVRLIAGNMNLVGSRPPLDAIRAGLDTDGSDLNVAEPFVLGDAAQFTWRDPRSPFPVGRLDYCVFSDAFADAVQAFVFDTRGLSEAALARIGLDREDTVATDHLPVVVDLKPR